ncbi:MAG: prepilin-type N-terminal cleavage/methylation domain-containing protein [Luteimonas sp.]|nr:prepilin-type N-terminal cleavage/methylation domain-containing protein [Luteimonas sp.]
MGARQRGYTLLEVIVAFSVLALALTLLLGSLSGSSRQVRWSTDAGRAALLAQSLLDQTGVGEALLPGRSEGELEEGRYRWSLEVAPFVDPDRPGAGVTDGNAPRLLRLQLTLAWREGGARERLQLSTLRLVQPDPRDGFQ